MHFSVCSQEQTLGTALCALTEPESTEIIGVLEVKVSCWNGKDGCSSRISEKLLKAELGVTEAPQRTVLLSRTNATSLIFSCSERDTPKGDTVPKG